MYICVTWMHTALQDVPKLVGKIAHKGMKSNWSQSPCNCVTNVNETLLPPPRRLMGEPHSFGV